LVALCALQILLLIYQWIFSPVRLIYRLDQSMQDMYSGVRKWLVVDETAIQKRRLDLAFFNRTTQEMAKLKFRMLHDVVDLEAETGFIKASVVMRVFLSFDGTTMACVYHARVGGGIGLIMFLARMRRNFRCIDFETELAGGRFVATSNAVEARHSPEIPGISRLFFPENSTPETLWAAHDAHLHVVLSKSAEVGRPISLRNFKEVKASQDRLHLMKVAFRKSAAYKPSETVSKIAAAESMQSEESVLLGEVLELLHKQRLVKAAVEAKLKMGADHTK
jgi:hypothetical protein